MALTGRYSASPQTVGENNEVELLTDAQGRIVTTIAAGSAVLGSVSISQTTPGTTDSVTVATAQGAGATIGTTADAVVAAGAVGTLSAKLRRVTQALDDLRTEEGQKTTYSATIVGLAIAAAATDIFTIIGSATTTVRIRRVAFSGLATAASATPVVLIKRSVADTLGTSTAPVAVPHDSTNAAATAVVRAYTANPTLGTTIAPMQARRITLTTAAGAIPNVPTVIELAIRGEQGIVLRGIAEQLALNFNGATVAGAVLDIDVTWTEEA